MTIQNLGLFKALNAKMGFLDQRQKVLAQNIANADTPDYKPNDLKEVDFSRYMKKISDSPRLQPAATHARHIPTSNDVRDPKTREQRETYDVAPAENGVELEEQIIKTSQNAMDYNMMTSIYQKNVDMIRMALGRGQ